MRLWQLLGKINKPDPGQFVSDKQCLATRNPFGSANLASFDEVGIEWKAGQHSDARRMVQTNSNRQCCVDSNDSETILAQIGGPTAGKDWVEPDYQGKMEI